MNVRLAVLSGMVGAAASFSGCASHVARTMNAPNAGITVTSSKLPGGPPNGEIKVIASNATYGTQWCLYQGSAPSNPVWRETTNVPGNPSPCAPGPWMVKLKANQSPNFQSNPVPVTVVAGFRTRVAVVYP